MTNEHQDGEREYHAILKDAYWVNDFRSPNIGGHIQGDTKGRFENGEWVSTSTVFEHLGDDIYRTRYSVYKVEWRDDRGEPSEPISGYTYTRARLDKAAVEPVPVDAGEWIVEAYPVHDANEAKQFLADTVDATENFSGTMYWVRDSENRAVAITGCGAKGKQNAERIASLPARRGVSEEAGKCEVLDQQAVSDALATYNESYGNGVDKGQCIRRAIRKYLDTLGLDAEGRPYALKQRLGGKSEDQ